ncbi:hypothetical protein [Xanthobacter aminoxidans]|uniref:Transposase n=1 Tax=Xanthobacter aminoxidans TaxID=186280 RepID=A0ABW6ZRM1_9HYPH
MDGLFSRNPERPPMACDRPINLYELTLLKATVETPDHASLKAERRRDLDPAFSAQAAEAFTSANSISA